MRDVAVVILARAPERGRAKTRLAAAIGPDRANEAYRRLLTITAAAIGTWKGPVLLAAGGSHAPFAGTGLEHLPSREQRDGPLGQRIAAAMACGFELAEKVLVIGSDCPGLTLTEMRAVGLLLQRAPVALGPAEDGGFWAIGATDPAVADAVARAEVRWSAPTTMAMLCAALAKQGFASELGPLLFDCDTVADFDRAVQAGLLTDHPVPELES